MPTDPSDPLNKPFGERALATLSSLSPWFAAGGALLQLGLGIGQMSKQSKLSRTRRPTMTTPQALTELYKARKFGAAKSGMPGERKYLANMQRQQASGLEAIRQSGQSGSSQLAAISALDQNTKQSAERMAAQEAQFQVGQEQMLDQTRRELAAQQRAEQEYNVLAPFRDKQLAQAALYQGGMTNISQFAANMSKIFAGDDDNKG